MASIMAKLTASAMTGGVGRKGFAIVSAAATPPYLAPGKRAR